MSLLFETLLIDQGTIPLLSYHNHRCNRSRLELIGIKENINLETAIKVPAYYKNALLRCRIDYDRKINTISYQLHQPREITKIKLVEIGDVDYAHKYADRQELQNFYGQRADCDEVLMLRAEMLTDCFYYNVALRKGEDWLTPNENLLAGTRRQYLLDQEVIQTASISVKDLQDFDQICLFNALTPFAQIVLDVSSLAY